MRSWRAVRATVRRSMSPVTARSAEPTVTRWAERRTADRPDNRDADGVISYIGRMQRVGGGRG